jgi:hypothetical protein
MKIAWREMASEEINGVMAGENHGVNQWRRNERKIISVKMAIMASMAAGEMAMANNGDIGINEIISAENGVFIESEEIAKQWR